MLVMVVTADHGKLGRCTVTDLQKTGNPVYFSGNPHSFSYYRPVVFLYRPLFLLSWDPTVFYYRPVGLFLEFSYVPVVIRALGR